VIFALNHESLPTPSYVTGADGTLRMYINVIGHVKTPGSLLVYDGVDLLSAISMAGGYLQGANLERIDIYGADGTLRTIKIENVHDIKFKPQDTIFIRQNTLSKIFTSSNIPQIFLSMLNIALTLDRAD
tara:strand:+ start:443 stop:829 length:387 start_codon:yes stop_codon:yes gene_type:complete